MFDKLTEEEMQQFVAIGCPFPYSPPETGVNADLLSKAVLKVLRKPAARSAKAAATALIYLAKQQRLEVFRDLDQTNDKSRRRLGFLMELMSQRIEADSARRLKELSSELHLRGDNTKQPLVLMAVCNDTMLEMFEQGATLLQEKWSVFSDVKPYVTEFDHV